MKHLRPRVVCVTGYKESGKDTAWSLAAKHFPYRRYSFAEPLRCEVDNILRLIDPIPEDAPEHLKELYREQIREGSFVDVWAKPTPPRLREILQAHGTDYRRKQYGEDYWLKRFSANVEKHGDAENPFFITDWRFPNEGDYAAERFGAVRWRITRANQNRTDSHVTEYWCDRMPVDVVLNNNGVDLYGFELVVLEALKMACGREAILA